MNSRIFSLNFQKLVVVWRDGRLFHSILVDEKKEFLKKVMFCIGKRNIIHIYCSYGVISTGMMLERY